MRELDKTAIYEKFFLINEVDFDKKLKKEKRKIERDLKKERRRIEKDAQKTKKEELKYQERVKKNKRKDFHKFVVKVIGGVNVIRLDNESSDFPEARITFYKYSTEEYQELINQCLQVLETVKEPYIYFRKKDSFEVRFGKFAEKARGWDFTVEKYIRYVDGKIMYSDI